MTLGEYQARLMAKHGLSVMPSYMSGTLASIENNAMRNRPTLGLHLGHIDPEAKAKREVKRMATLRERYGDRRSAGLIAALKCLTVPRTSAEIARITGLQASRISNILTPALTRGEVIVTMHQRKATWRMADASQSGHPLTNGRN
ncbi:MAG: hypothetical protein ACRCXM_08950 [Beijerinckiaceae bacterium]